MAFEWDRWAQIWHGLNAPSIPMMSIRSLEGSRQVRESRALGNVGWDFHRLGLLVQFDDGHSPAVWIR